MDTVSAQPGNPYAAAAVPATRFDIYVFIHKALREFMHHTVAAVGAMDVADAGERAEVCDQVELLLATLRGHVQHENDFIHTAIEARRPGGAADTTEDHVGHLEAIANLEDEAHALRSAAPGQRAALALRLYRHLAVFVGENLLHMQVEETHNNAALWALYRDDELLELHERLMATIPPQEMALVLRWMAMALSVPELAILFAELRAKAPPQAVEALLGVVREPVPAPRWARLAMAIGRQP
ncbi:hemerythrin domain-containing protein [Rubrivivax gelatinosus]|uniref:Hemerythrin-like domain-containing protein n=1 Tax=Rubrivivax gelatinosus TaxID=28068 RepID=A0ABS1E484_RUBGE|nr:hypothetical protein [Rubrivivax gelatinosus]MBK1715740.1 hypothetical protein [Rubrivivax gelatinosus]